MQIVEITAVTDNINSHCIGNSNAVLPVANRSQLQCTSKAIEKVEIKCVPVPSKVEKKLCDVCVQTPADPTDQKNVVVPVINQRTPEDTVRKLNTSQSVANTDMSTPHRGVQFRDNGIVADNTNSCNWNLSNTVRPNVQYLPKDSSSYSGNSVDILNMDSAISCCSQTQPMKTTIQEISMHPTQRFGSTDTLRESVESTSKPTEISDIKSCVKNSGRETEDKLSDRIKRKIDSLEGGTCVSTQSSIQDTNVSLGPQHGSFRTQTNTLLCTDICKDMASQAKFFKTYTDRSNASDADSSVSTQYTNILPSVFSNNPSIPHITLDTTETLEWKSPSRNQSSKATVGAVMPSSSLYVSPDNTDNYLSQNFTVEDISSGSRMNQDYSRNLLSEQQHPAYDRVRVSGTEDTKSRGPEKRIAKLDSTTGTRAYWTDEAIDLSKIGFNEDSFIQPEHINTSDEVNTSHIIGSSSLIRDRIEDTTLNHNKSFKNIAVGTNLLSFPPIGEYRAATNTNCENKPQYALSKPNTRNIIRSSDLTRPEFIRMLTEIKERTCGLEKQLSAMNEAIKRKQAIRNKEHRATVKHHEAMRQDHFPYKTQDNKIRTTDELPFNTSELSSIEAAQPSLEVSKIKPSIAISHCGPLHDISISENKFHNDKTFHGRMIQSNQNDNFSPLQPRRVPKTSTPTNWSPEQEQISIVCGELNVSVSKQKPKKPIFKTKRNYLPYRHLGQSDHKIWKHRVHNTTPSVKSMTASTDPLEPASLESYMVSSKIDTHSSPTNCCDIPETSGQTPSLQTVFDARCISNAVVRSGGCAISSNRHIHRMAMQPSSCDLDETKDSNTQLNCCLGTEVTDTVLGVLMKNKEHVNPNFASQVKRFKLKPRQGIEQSFVKSRTKRDPQSIPSNTILSSSTSRTSFHESLSSICAKKRVNQYDSAKPSSFKLKNSGAVEVLNHNVEADDSQSYFDPVCCSTMRNDEIVSGENVPLPSKQTESIPVEQPKQYSGKDENYACPIMTQQATPISLNTDSNFKSEEEESSMDYDLNKSA